MSDLINIKDDRFWQILFDEACVEGKQAERIKKELEQITVEPVHGEWIPYYGGYACSHCRTEFNDDIEWLQGEQKMPVLCPECGASMKKKVTE